MQESDQWDFQASLQDSDEEIDIQDTIDIQYTDLESESDSVHTSDNDFIDPQDDLCNIGDYDPSYTDELSSLASSNNDFHGKLWDKGKYDEFDVLDKRHIEGANGRVPQVLIQCWVKESIVQDLRDLLRVYRQETPE
ncbi:uncharacterized protein ASPGLDRAFT_56229 [Aspergillus glaucus CBS 516.65]|uniref:Uncharacterized protein n=1 Tax=Aspergillus glaucus CBS 516.65 TaxID=1160497 RepID=A0A1L9VRS5_ASPGL|nr:hypothetical protein ASPGLDRAFT_56229 [Aspergillus glaucus CBS 516.65]OJJ86638.1 hypothetical protein ASPGLDRAFT_56229 [Aspergillus glaucus CBS 516.65]